VDGEVAKRARRGRIDDRVGGGEQPDERRDGAARDDQAARLVACGR
jgi:hypothetical protein